jgi:hypothetical protein
MTITLTDKLACLERELKYRKRVYARLVDRGKMTAQQSQRELELMEAIAQDYRELAPTERLL